MEEMLAIPEVMFYPSQMRRKPYMDMILSTMTTEPIQDVDRTFPYAVCRYFWFLFLTSPKLLVSTIIFITSGL